MEGCLARRCRQCRLLPRRALAAILEAQRASGGAFRVPSGYAGGQPGGGRASAGDPVVSRPARRPASQAAALHLRLGGRREFERPIEISRRHLLFVLCMPRTGGRLRWRALRAHAGRDGRLRGACFPNMGSRAVSLHAACKCSARRASLPSSHRYSSHVGSAAWDTRPCAASP